MTESKTVQVLGFAGSLRAGSYNRALLRAAVELAPLEMAIRVFDLAPIPLYNGDVEAQGDPPAVAEFKAAIRAADSLLIVTPEYNYSIPGVLKNAIDWASRPPDKSPLPGKPLAIMGASSGNWGTVRSQMHLRQVCVFNDLRPLNRPEVMVPHAADKFNPQGLLTDQYTRDAVRKLLLALREWTRRWMVAATAAG